MHSTSVPAVAIPSSKSDGGGPNLFPRRRRRHFTSGLASRLFSSNADNSGTASKPSYPHQSNGESTEQAGRKSPLSRGGLRRDRMGNVVGTVNHGILTPTKQKPTSNSPRTISSRKSTRTDRTDPIDNSFASSSPSPVRGDESPDDIRFSGDNWNHRKGRAKSSTHDPPLRSHLRRGGTGERGKGAPLAVSVDQDEENTSTPFLLFPATSPPVHVEDNVPAATYSPDEFEDDTDSSLSCSIENKRASPGPDPSHAAAPTWQDLKFVTPNADVQMRMSPVEQQIKQLQHRSPRTVQQKNHSPGRRVAEWLSSANKQVSVRDSASGLARSLDQGIEMLLDPVQKFVQCAAPMSAAEAEKLAQPIPLQKASSTVSGASTEVATNRGVDIAKRRIREMEEQIERRRVAAEQQQQVLQEQRLLQEQLNRISSQADESLPSDEEDAIVRQLVQTRKAVRNYRKGQEDDGDEPPYIQPSVIYRSRLSFGAPKIAPKQLEQKSILSVSDDESSRMTHSTAQSNQQHILLQSSPIVAGPPSTIVPKRKRFDKQVDLVPAHQPEILVTGETSSMQSVSQSSSMKVEVHRNQLDKNKTREMFSGVQHGEPLQPLHESINEEATGQVISRGTNEHADLMIPNLSPSPVSNTEAFLPMKNHPYRPPSSPKSDGALNISRVNLNDLSTLSPKSDYAVLGHRVTRTRAVGGDYYLSPPGVSGRIPLVGQDSPDPVFCSKSMTSTTPTSTSGYHTISSGYNTTGSCTVLDRDSSFDSSVMNHSKGSLVSGLKAVEEEKDEDFVPTTGIAPLSKMSCVLGNVSMHGAQQLISLPMPTEMPNSGRSYEDSNFQLSHRADKAAGPPSTMQGSVSDGGCRNVPTLADLAVMSSFARSDSLDDPLPTLPKDSKMKSAGNSKNTRVANISGQWPRSTGTSRKEGDDINESESRREMPEIDVSEEESSLYRKTPAWNVMKSLRNERKDTLSNGPKTYTHVDRSIQAAPLALHQSKRSSFHTAFSLFEKKPDSGGHVSLSTPPRRHSKLGAMLSTKNTGIVPQLEPEELSIGVQSLKSVFESVNSRSTHDCTDDDGGSVKSLRQKLEGRSNSTLLRSLREEDDVDDDTASVKSLREKFEGTVKSVTSRSLQEQDDDTASVRSLKDKFEGTTKNVDQGVKKMRDMFEAKSRPITKPFGTGTAELQEVFSKFQSRQTAKERVRRATSISNRMNQRKASGTKANALSARGGLETKPSPVDTNRNSQTQNGDCSKTQSTNSGHTSQVSVADRVKSFGSMSRFKPLALPVRTRPSVAQNTPDGFVRWRNMTEYPKRGVGRITENPSQTESSAIELQKAVGERHHGQDRTKHQTVAQGRGDLKKESKTCAHDVDHKSAGRDMLAQAVIAAKLKPLDGRSNRNASLMMVASPPTRRSAVSIPLPSIGDKSNSYFLNSNEEVRQGNLSNHVDEIAPLPLWSNITSIEEKPPVTVKDNYTTDETFESAADSSRNKRSQVTEVSSSYDAPTNQKQEQMVAATTSHHHVTKKKEDSDSAMSSSESDFSDGVTLDVSIAEVSGLTLPTVLADKGASNSDARDDETSSEVSNKLETDARRSEASSSQTPEILAPLIARGMQTSDELSASNNLFDARASSLDQRQSVMDAHMAEKSDQGELHSEEKKSDEGHVSAGWDGSRVRRMFPDTSPADQEIFRFDSEWRSVPSGPMESAKIERESGSSRHGNADSKTFTVINRVKQDSSKSEQPLEDRLSSSSEAQVPRPRLGLSSLADGRPSAALTRLRRVRATGRLNGHKKSTTDREEKNDNSVHDHKAVVASTITRGPSTFLKKYNPNGSTGSKVTSTDSSPSDGIRRPTMPSGQGVNEESPKTSTASSRHSSSLMGNQPRRYRTIMGEAYATPDSHRLLPRIPETDTNEHAKVDSSSPSVKKISEHYTQALKRTENTPKQPPFLATTKRYRHGQLGEKPIIMNRPPDPQRQVNSDNAAMVARLRILKESRIRRSKALFMNSPDHEDQSCSTKSSTQFGGTHFNHALNVD